MDPVGLKAQYEAYGPHLLDSVKKVLSRGDYILGKQVDALEEQLARFVRVKYCLTTSSGSDGLFLALRALGIGAGDEVITTPFTFIATASSIVRAGACPVFVDIEKLSYLLAVDEIENKITAKTKAILAVSLFGQMPNFSKIHALAKAYGLFVIEDGAQSFGATQEGTRSGGGTDVGITSFFPTKPFGGFGDGGALFTNDQHVAKRIRMYRNHGLDDKQSYSSFGINGRLDTLQAALLLEKLPYFEKELVKRRAIAKKYDEALQGVCQTPTTLTGNSHVFGQYTLATDQRDALLARLKKAGVFARVYYSTPLHLQPVFAYLGHREGDFPISEWASLSVLSLPLHPWLTEKEQNNIIDAICVRQSLALEGGDKI